jgi:lipid II:glycine glycyltransferase (peptidoglycan interpeptide bridge formation enzyme)
LILPKLGKYEIRETNIISKYYYDKKVLCFLKLNDESNSEWKELSSKLRSQIKKGYKNGITVRMGGEEYLNDFYTIYSTNMHRLGSPVLSKMFFSNLIKDYENGIAKIFLAYFNNIAVAGSIVLSYHNLIEVGWASTLDKYNRFNPNMVLYWEMIKYSIENGLNYFSFGRASKGSGSHKFKLQWGCIETQLYFNYSEQNIDIRRFKPLAKLWKIVPTSVANKIGPIIRTRLHI